MNKQISIFLIFLFTLVALSPSFSQELEKVELSDLFLEDAVLPIRLKYSNREIKKETNDSTFINTYLSYKTSNDGWDSIQVRLRKRGNFRLNNCFYAPIKIKIKKSAAKASLFEGHKNLKLVMPCKTEKSKDDNILKEYLAYKMYEIISAYHFKARLVDVQFTDDKGKKSKLHEIKGILVEDDKHIAKRIGGKVWPRKVHPLNQLDHESVRNAFFQYMIGNTDFSNAYSHNCKLFYLEGEIIPIPYDFDMSGLVNASYSVVSQINNNDLGIQNVTERLYRGFIRDPQIYTEIRLEYLANRLAIIEEIEKLKPMFSNSKSYDNALDFVNKFFLILMDDNKFEKLILNKARTK